MNNKEAQPKAPNRFARAAGRAHENYPWIAEVLGWYGISAILLAYALVSFEVVAASSYIYQLLNFTGAVGVVVISVAKKATQPAVLNVVWALVALTAIASLVIGNIDNG